MGKDCQHAFIVFSFLLAYNTIYLIAIQTTIINISNTIELSGCAISYILAIFILNEKITFWKTSSVLFVIGGIAVIILLGLNVKSNENEENLKDQQQQQNSTTGYFLLIIAVFFYSLYGVVAAKLRKNKNQIEDVLIFIGLFGFIDIVVYWTILFIFHFLNFEIFEFPKTNECYWLILLGIDGALLTACYLGGVFIMGPVFMSIGATFIAPIGNVTEYFLKGMTFHFWYYIGMSMILLSVVFFALGEICAKLNQTTNDEKISVDCELCSSKNKIQQQGNCSNISSKI